MSKLFIRVIQHCFACPHHFRWTYKEPSKWMCDKCQYREILTSEVDTHGKDFPEWCPLDNAERGNELNKES